MGETIDEGDDPRTPFETARLAAFIDAVVAIAMTLLILPLMESVSEVATAGDDTAEWFREHQGQLVSFFVSFAVIALFWIIHHRLFAKVRKATQGLLWITMLWLLSIVWLPVATAISGQMADEDDLAKVVYIGSMIATCLCSLLIRVYLWRHAWLHRLTRHELLAGMSADIATAALFAVALAVALIFPQWGYWPLLIMTLSSPLQALLARTVAGRAGAQRGS